MKIKRICEQCAAEFSVYPCIIKRGGGKFCSPKCSQEARKAQVKRICQQCGIEFPADPSQIKRNKGKFCSPKCFHESRKKTYVKRICKQCGKELKVCPSDIKYGCGKFCNLKCKAKWQSKYRKGKNSSNWRGGKVKCICKQCGKVRELYPSDIKQGYGKFCSLECIGKWQSEHIRGENHPSWKGGISFEPYCSKFNNEFKEYIRAKFGRICFLCQKTEEENGQKLSVHHVNYNKNCGCDEDETCQFVPLCIGCNSKVNSNRSEWEAKIKAMMKNKLNGWYI